MESQAILVQQTSECLSIKKKENGRGFELAVGSDLLSFIKAIPMEMRGKVKLRVIPKDSPEGQKIMLKTTSPARAK